MPAITIPEQLIAEIAAHGAAAYPYECCGALYGWDEGAVRHVAGTSRIDNSSDEDRRRRFSVSPHEYMRAEREADERGMVLLGFYHSHPDHPPLPSATDRAYAQPGFSYPIISMVGGSPGRLRSWRLADMDGEYIEEEVRRKNED